MILMSKHCFHYRSLATLLQEERVRSPPLRPKSPQGTELWEVHEQVSVGPFPPPAILVSIHHDIPLLRHPVPPKRSAAAETQVLGPGGVHRLHGYSCPVPNS